MARALVPMAMLSLLSIAAVLFGSTTALYLVGAFLVTVLANVPMNGALEEVSVPTDPEAARQIWQDYSPAWQMWNIFRTVVSGVALLLTGGAIYFLDRDPA